MPAKKIAVFAGTRPELIKQKPILKALVEHYTDITAMSVLMKQHNELLDKERIDVKCAQVVYDTPALRECKSPQELLPQLQHGAQSILAEHKPDLVLVQGDTLTAFAVANAAFLMSIPVGHVEAGLRTRQGVPFPEERLRKMISAITDLHFAPTVEAANNLEQEGYTDGIHVVGNTSADALVETLKEIRGKKTLPFVLVTCHRREGWDTYLPTLVKAISAVKDSVDFVWPVHPNPLIKKIVGDLASDPVDHRTFVQLLLKADLVITDSGGVQEEANMLGKKVLLMRQWTERNEVPYVLAKPHEHALREQIVELALTERDDVDNLLRNKCYGKGDAGFKIAYICRNFLND